MTHPLYEHLREVLPQASVLLADNPGTMTLDGTNTWLLRAPGSPSAVVVDPGPDDEAHLAGIVEAAGEVAAILLTHGHPDHSDGAGSLHRMTGVPVRALDPAHRYGGGPGLAEGDVIEAAGVALRVWATPGHTSDSLSFLLDPDGDGAAAVLSGDTILGRGTTVVAHPDGDLGRYLDSLRRLRDVGRIPLLPGHGPEHDSVAALAEQYLCHREERLAQVRAALAELGPDASAREIVELVYADVPRSVWRAAEQSVRAQLAYLRA